jgi:exosortase A-associated hydrolase 2
LKQLARVQAFFLEADPGRRFCVFHPSSAPLGRGVVYVHPFAEEMNKSRRMAALQARSLAERGFDVLLIDLHGCGDSSGDFGDATWRHWLDDVARACQWFEARGVYMVYLWGLRLGALLALQAYGQRRLRIAGFLLWQPVVSGEAHLTQFLRLRVANQMLAGGAAGESTTELRRRLQAGESLEIAGYTLNTEMAAAIDSLKLAQLAPRELPVWWCEVVNEAGKGFTPASQKVLDGWREQGVPVATRMVVGEAFWATQEIAECPTLITATDEMLSAAP